jgi:adenylosuccinate synthase
MRYIIVISGPVGVGKSELAKALIARFGAARISTRELLIDRTGTPNERKPLQEAGERLDQETDGAWVAQGIEPIVARLPPDSSASRFSPY